MGIQNCMNKKINKHTSQSLTEVLIKKGLSDFLKIKSIDRGTSEVIIEDLTYGDYKVDLKCFCANTPMGLHKKRRHFLRMEKFKSEHIGTKLKDSFIVTDAFYGPDRGYKNRSFYLEYASPCGHKHVNSKVTVLKYLKTFRCLECDGRKHGVRGKKNGERIKRTSTYTYWQKYKKDLPSEYQEFVSFRFLLGDRPSPKAKVECIDNKFIWVDRQDLNDSELNLMATYLRQAFRHSIIYKKALEDAKVETDRATLYRCRICKELFKLKQVQVDHVSPIVPINGDALKKYDLIDRIWTDNVQVLDRGCHLKKTMEENKWRKRSKNECTDRTK